MKIYGLKELEKVLLTIGLKPYEVTNEYKPLGNETLIRCLQTTPSRRVPGSKAIPLRIVKNGVATIVFWQDGTKTVVKRGSDDPDSDYAAFTAALGIKTFGSNSALKRIVSRTETQEKKDPKAYRFVCRECGAVFVKKENAISVMADNTIKTICPKCNRPGVYELPKAEKVET